LKVINYSIVNRMGCVSSEEANNSKQYSPSSSTSSLEMIEPFIYLNKKETQEMIYKNNIKKLFKEEYSLKLKKNN